MLFLDPIAPSFEATNEVIKKLRERDYTRISEEKLRTTDGYVGYHHPQLGIDDLENYDNNAAYFRQVDRINGINKNLAERTIEHRIQTEIVSVKDGMVAREREKLGRVGSEYEWGQVEQILQEYGATALENLKLDHHIDRFIAYHQRRYAEGKIRAGRLNKIINTIRLYREWSPIINSRVDRIGEKQHIDAYDKRIGDRMIAGEIGAEYASQLFVVFKMLIDWLVDEEVLNAYPACLQRKRNRYTFTVERSAPEDIPLDIVHQLLHFR